MWLCGTGCQKRTLIPDHIGVDEAELSVRPTEIWIRMMSFIETFWVDHYITIAPVGRKGIHFGESVIWW